MRKVAPRVHISRRSPRVDLSRHLATIESYLEDYRTISSNSDTDRVARQSNRDYFQKYILTSCWAKMHARAEHWISMGMITQICNIPDLTVLTTAEFNIEMRADRDLIQFLNGSFKEPGSLGYIGEILEYHNHRMEGVFSNPKYKDDISVDPILKACGQNYHYTPEIAVAFHNLLVSALLSYVFRLRIVDKAVATLADVPGPNPPAAVVTAFIQLLLSVQLLFYVSHSRLFKTYLKLLSTLQIPVEGRAMLYRQVFAKFTAWHTHHVHDKRLMEDLTPSQPRPDPVDDEPRPDPVDDEAVDEVLDCLLGLEPVSEDQPDVLFRRRIMGMVDHFASICVLERVSRILPPKAKFNFSLLGLNRPSLLSDSWAKMKDQIRTLCQDDSLVSKARESKKSPPPHFANKAIRIIETKIQDYVEASPFVNKTSLRFEAMVYSFFKSLHKQKTLKFRGCGHCEAILMAIIHRISKKNDLDFSLKACSP